MKSSILIICVTLLLTISCNEEEVITSHSIIFQFEQTVDQQPVEVVKLVHTNAAGNLFSIENLQYVVSEIVLYHSSGQSVAYTGHHFVDFHDLTTLSLDPSMIIREGTYDSLSFVFGLRGESNTSGIHTDLNLLNWGWPEMLGGGYHFMKLEGKFLDENQNETGFATHMGTARELDGNSTVFHENHIEITLRKSFSINAPSQIPIKMEVLNWYTNPNTWNLNQLGTMIMPNYEAQIKLNQNGHDVFSLGAISTYE